MIPNKSLWPINETSINTTILGQGKPGNNGIEELLQTSWGSKIGASPSEAYPGYHNIF